MFDFCGVKIEKKKCRDEGHFSIEMNSCLDCDMSWAAYLGQQNITASFFETNSVKNYLSLRLKYFILIESVKLWNVGSNHWITVDFLTQKSFLHLLGRLIKNELHEVACNALVIGCYFWYKIGVRDRALSPRAFSLFLRHFAEAKTTLSTRHGILETRNLVCLIP